MKRLLFALLTLVILKPGALAQPATKPATFLLDADRLAASKAALKNGDSALQAALKSLLSQADNLLSKPAHSVMEKSKTPSSGTKHDYLSVGPYWWPDPNKPDGLPYIRKDGQVNPERHAIEDEGYLKDLCAYVQTLAVAYYFSDDEKYARKAAELLRVWFLNADTRMNPNLNFGQAIPGITEGRGIGLIDTAGLAKLVDAVQLLQGSKAWAESDQLALQGWFRQFLTWMKTSPLGKDEEKAHNNHGTYYDMQTVAFALFLGDKPMAKQMLEQQTKARIQSQLKPDGSQPDELARTKSWNYSLMNLRGFMALARMGEQVGVNLWQYETPDGKSLKKAYQWMQPYANGQPWTYQQIEPIHYEDFTPVRLLAQEKFGLPSVGTGADSQKMSPLLTLTHATY